MKKLISTDPRLNDIIFQLSDEEQVFDRNNEYRIPGVLIRKQEFLLTAPYVYQDGEFRLFNARGSFGGRDALYIYKAITQDEVRDLAGRYLESHCPLLLTHEFQKTATGIYRAHHKGLDGLLHNAFLAHGFLHKAIKIGRVSPQ